MRESDAANTNFDARRLWELPCVAIKVFLTYGMRPDTLRAYMRSHIAGPGTPSLDNDAWVLRLAHQVCHTQNPLSERIEAQLKIRFRVQIRIVRESSYLSLVRLLTDRELSPFELAGVLWALQTDTASAKRCAGVNLMKAMALERRFPPKNIGSWPGKLQPLSPRKDPHRWN